MTQNAKRKSTKIHDDAGKIPLWWMGHNNEIRQQRGKIMQTS